MTPSERAALGRSRTFFAVLVNMSVMGPLALNIVMPSLPGLETVFAASRESVQLTISLYMLGTAFAQIVMGTLADYFGRRPVALAGAAIYALASIAAMFSPSIEALVAARFIQSVGATAGISLSRAIVRDVFDREKSASMIGYVTVGSVVAPMFAPLIGGLIDDNFGWRAIFLFCAVIGGLTLTGTALYLPETRPDTVAAGESGVIRRGLALLGNGRFHLYVLTGTGTVYRLVKR